MARLPLISSWVIHPLQPCPQAGERGPLSKAWMFWSVLLFPISPFLSSFCLCYKQKTAVKTGQVEGADYSWSSFLILRVNGVSWSKQIWVDLEKLTQHTSSNGIWCNANSGSKAILFETARPTTNLNNSQNKQPLQHKTSTFHVPADSNSCKSML